MADRALEERSTMRGGRALLAKQGVVAGLLAGVIFGLGEMLVGRAMGSPLLMPWRAFASTVLGRAALEGPLTFGIFFVGFVAHFALCAIYGAVWGVLSSFLPYSLRISWGGHSLVAMVYGLALYLVNFLVFAPLLYPWFRTVNQPAQIFFHVVLFGLPLGMLLVARLRPVTGMKAVRRASI